MSDLYALRAREYATVLGMGLQEKPFILLPGITINPEMARGEAAQSIVKEEPTEAQTIDSTDEDIVAVVPSNEQRWITPTWKDHAQWINKEAELQTLLDPQSTKVKNGISAMNRARTRMALDALFGTAVTGTHAGSTVSFDSGMEIAVDYGGSGDTAMTVAKILKAVELLQAQNVDVDNPDEIWCALGPNQWHSMMLDTQFINADYNTEYPLMTGRIKSFHNVNFLRTNLIDAAVSNVQDIPIWAKSHFHGRWWEALTVSIDKRITKRGQGLQIYIKEGYGFSRDDEQAVVKVKCKTNLV